MKIDQAIENISKALINAGKLEYTVDFINRKLTDTMQAEGYSTKAKALSVLKSDPSIKRALDAGPLRTESFDVLAVTDGVSRDGKETKFQEIVIAITKANKPEIRRAMLYDRTIPITAGVAYTAKINIGDNGRVDFPDNCVLTPLEKPFFTPQQLISNSSEISEARIGQSGLWYGDIGRVDPKENGNRIEVSSMSSMKATTVWDNKRNELLKGDSIVLYGYYGKTGISANFIIVVPEEKIADKYQQLL